MIGGSEVGHITVRMNGRPCTCGRLGCLESYVSIRALCEDASKAANEELSIDEVFRRKDEEKINEVIQNYTETLGTGIVNIVNLFRPQIILLGGMMSDYVHELIPQLNMIMESQCFGGKHGKIPQIAAAKLGKEAGVIGAANL